MNLAVIHRNTFKFQSTRHIKSYEIYCLYDTGVGERMMNGFSKIVLGLLIALTASHNSWGAVSDDLSWNVTSADLYGENIILKLFGNANMDDAIDENDVSYIGGILANENKVTELADANQDGKVDQGDIERIRQIINGTESELYYVNIKNEVAKVKHPLNKIIVVYDNTAEIIRILGAQDRVVGVDSDASSSIQYRWRYMPEFNKTPSIGHRNDCDVEKILEIKPDAVIVHAKNEWGCPDLEKKIEDSNIDVVRLGTSESQFAVPSLMILSYMLDEVDNAKEYREWQHGYLEMVKERVSSISADERLRVFVDRPGNTTAARGSGYAEVVEMAGGRNIATDLAGGWQGYYPTVDTEWVLKENPDAMVILGFSAGYEVDNESILKARYDQVLGIPGFVNIKAAKDNKVFVSATPHLLGPGYHIGVLYFAKWFYPDLFEDLDPQSVHQEFIDRFQHVDYRLDEHGVFAYVPK